MLSGYDKMAANTKPDTVYDETEPGPADTSSDSSNQTQTQTPSQGSLQTSFKVLALLLIS